MNQSIDNPKYLQQQQQPQPQLQQQLSQRSQSVDSIISQRKPPLLHQQNVFSELDNIQNDASLSQRSQSDSQISRLRRQVSIQEPIMQPSQQQQQQQQQRSRPTSRLSQSQLSVHQEIVPDPMTEQQFLMEYQTDNSQHSNRLQRQQSILSATSNYTPSIAIGSSFVGDRQPIVAYPNTNVGIIDQGQDPLHRSLSQTTSHVSIDPDIKLNHQLQQISLSASQLSQQLQHSIQSRLQQQPQLQHQDAVVINPYQQFTPIQQRQPPQQQVFVQQRDPPSSTDHQLVSSHQSTSLSQTQPLSELVKTLPQKVSQSQQTTNSDKEKNKEESDNGEPAFEEDRYLYLCLKNRELLLKKIKQCESLEKEIRSGWKEHFPDNELS